MNSLTLPGDVVEEILLKLNVVEMANIVSDETSLQNLPLIKQFFDPRWNPVLKPIPRLQDWINDLKEWDFTFPIDTGFVDNLILKSLYLKLSQLPIDDRDYFIKRNFSIPALMRVWHLFSQDHPYGPVSYEGLNYLKPEYQNLPILDYPIDRYHIQVTVFDVFHYRNRTEYSLNIINMDGVVTKVIKLDDPSSEMDVIKEIADEYYLHHIKNVSSSYPIRSALFLSYEAIYILSFDSVMELRPRWYRGFDYRLLTEEQKEAMVFLGWK